jgi:Fe-S-cluster containining protein
MKTKASAGNQATGKLFKSLKKLRPKILDELFHESHAREFARIDCLSCANCCKTTSPAMYDSDVSRMAKAMKLKRPEFIDRYLRLDEDNEYVFKSIPCPFLRDDNYCIVYDSRPKACREYPHTDRRRMHQILDLTARNARICPAVFNIVRQLQKQY